MIDSGSNVTCINKDFANKHNLLRIGSRSSVQIRMLNDIVTIPGDHYQVELKLSSNEQSCTKNVTAWSIKGLARSTKVVVWSEQKKKFRHLKRDRSFDRITFFQNSSVVLSKFVLKEKIHSFEYRPRLNVLSNDVLSKFRTNKIRRKKKNLFSPISSLVR